MNLQSYQALICTVCCLFTISKSNGTKSHFTLSKWHNFKTKHFLLKNLIQYQHNFMFQIIFYEKYFSTILFLMNELCSWFVVAGSLWTLMSWSNLSRDIVDGNGGTSSLRSLEILCKTMPAKIVAWLFKHLYFLTL